MQPGQYKHLGPKTLHAQEGQVTVAMERDLRGPTVHEVAGADRLVRGVGVPDGECEGVIPESSSHPVDRTEAIGHSLPSSFFLTQPLPPAPSAARRAPRATAASVPPRPTAMPATAPVPLLCPAVEDELGDLNPRS